MATMMVVVVMEKMKEGRKNDEESGRPEGNRPFGGSRYR
jgi:hypothetical protein